MTLKQTLVILMTHLAWECYGFVAIFNQPLLFRMILGMFIGMLTYFTYKNLLKGE